MKKIYIVLTYTGTVLSRVIKWYTKAEYSHVSLALDSELKEMYSFGRLNPYDPFHLGFVHEGIEIGMFKRFSNTTAEIYSLEVTDYQYKKIKKKIKQTQLHREDFGFNIMGLFASGFHIRYHKVNKFYCAEFVKYLLDDAGIMHNLPSIIQPIDFQKFQLLELIYQGILKQYHME